jgi:hypothetical protein
VGGDEKVTNECERRISSGLETSTSSVRPINTKKRRNVSLGSDSRSNVTDDANKCELGEMNVFSLLRGVEENKRRRIDQAESDAGKIVSSAHESREVKSDEEPELDVKHQSEIRHSENTTESNAVSTNVAFHEEELLERASEVLECDPRNCDDEEIQELHESLTGSVTQDHFMFPISAKDWNSDLLDVSSPHWDSDEDFLDFAPIPLSDFGDKTNSVINELLGDEGQNTGDHNDITNHALSPTARPPHVPLLCTVPYPGNVEERGESPRTIESAAGNFGASTANGTPLLAVFRCIPLQEPMLSMHLR